MTVQESVSKLKGMAENLRGNFAETTALFHMARMSANEDVRDRFFASEKADGFKIIRTALHRSLILQLAGANFDDSKNKLNPSIKALLSRFYPDGNNADTRLVGYLEDQYARSAPGLVVKTALISKWLDSRLWTSGTIVTAHCAPPRLPVDIPRPSRTYESPTKFLVIGAARRRRPTANNRVTITKLGSLASP